MCIPSATIAGAGQHPFNTCLRCTWYRGCRPTHQIPVANTNLSPGLLYTLHKHVAFNQCCFNIDPQFSTLARHWNTIGWLYRLFWLLHYAGDTLTSRHHKHQKTRYIGPMLMWCWVTVCDAGPTLFQPKPFKLLTTNIIVNIFFWTLVKDKSTQPKDLKRYIAHVHKDWCTEMWTVSHTQYPPPPFP